MCCSVCRVRKVLVKPGFQYDLNGLRSVCDMIGAMIGNWSASCCRHMKTFAPSICGCLQHTVGVIGKVEPSSTFRSPNDADRRRHRGQMSLYVCNMTKTDNRSWRRSCRRLLRSYGNQALLISLV